MKKLLITGAVIALGASAPMFAQYTTPSTMPEEQQQQTAPTQSTTPSQATPDQSAPDQPAKPDMTGQELYNSEGEHIGTITAMSTSSDGQHLAVVDVERHMGMGADRVLFPVNTLQPRDKGGYMTSLSREQIEQLPKANATNSGAGPQH
ncbi:MAG: PRC-barrel domain-containing protein [Alphaproteobacteria bacterium]|nr:PRC-barrel domain-containing protein [Alphaproteobacteria bacterium]